MNLIRAIGLVLLWLVGCSLHAATIQVEVDRNPVGIDESFQLVFKTTEEPDGEPDFSPLEPYLEILNRGRSSNISIINGQYESSNSWTLTAMPRQRGKLTLPSIAFGNDKSPPYELIVKGAVVRRDQQTEFFTRIEFDRSKLYVQQQLLVKQYIFSATNLASFEFGDLKFSGVDALIEPLGNPKQYTKQVGQQTFVVIEKRFAVFPLASGTMKLDPVVSGAQQGVSRGSFFLPFGGQPKVLRARSRARQIEVLPVPPAADMNPWLPVENLELVERWSDAPVRFVVGEPVTRTVMLRAEGITAAQLPELAGVSIDSIKQYPEQPKLNDIRNDSGIIGYREQNVAFIPIQPGQVQLPAIEVPWWDVETQSRQVARIPAQTIEVHPAAGANPSTTPLDSLATEDDSGVAESKDTVTLEPATEAPTPPVREDPGLWPFLTLVMGLGWVTTILIWVWQNRSPGTALNQRNRREATLKQRFKALAQACKQQDASACRRELLAWGESMFPDHRMTGLRDLIARVPATMAAELLKIDAVLYGGQQADIDFRLIRAQARQVMLEAARPATTSVDVLEPLYK